MKRHRQGGGSDAAGTRRDDIDGPEESTGSAREAADGQSGWPDRPDVEPSHRHVPGYVPQPSVPGSETPHSPQRPAAPAPPDAGRWSVSPEPLPRPVSPTPYEPAGSPSRREPERQQLLPPGGSWGWRQSLAGLALAFTPELLLYAIAKGVGAAGTTTAKVTAGSALVLVVSSLVTYGWHVFAAWLFSLRRAAAGLRAWGFRKPSAAIFWTVPTAIIAVYAVSYFHDLLVHPKQQQLVHEFPHSGAGLALFLILAVLIAPVFEELFFRGFLFQGLANSWGWLAGAVVSAAIFALLHLQLDIFVPLFALGFALAWVYHRTGSLWSNITLHALFNAISVFAWYLTK